MIFVCFVVAQFALLVADSEPLCLSRFDYDYKVLSKLVELETAQNRALEKITEQQTVIDKQNKMLESITEQQTFIDKLQHTTEELETGQKRVLERITEQQNENEKQKKMLETISEQRTIVDKLQNTTEELETGQKRVLETITEQQTVNEKQKKILETMSEQQIVIDKLQNIIRGSKSTNVGTTYTRWGKPSCPGNGTETIYSGLVAGSHYTHKGAAANYLCLTQQPSWNKYNDKQEAGGLVYGAEYEFYHRSRQHFFGREIIDEDPPCAVCRTERPTVIMIPGSRHCRDGWTMEYHGYLSSGSYGQPAATEFVCLDVDPEVISGGRSNNNGKLFYLTEIRCGSSSICPPYVNGRELSCVVCSK